MYFSSLNLACLVNACRLAGHSYVLSSEVEIYKIGHEKDKQKINIPFNMAVETKFCLWYKTVYLHS